MSGGSYDYASNAADLEDLQRQRTALRSLAERLETLDADDAAADLLGLLDYATNVERRVAARLARLGPLMHAVEWADSGDWGPDDVALELMRYRAEAITHAHPAPRRSPDHAQRATRCGELQLRPREELAPAGTTPTCPCCLDRLTR